MKDIMSNFPVELSDVLVADPEAVAADLQELDTRHGSQSRIGLMGLSELPEDGVLLKRMGVDKNLTQAEAVSLRDSLTPYRASLCASGWNVPALYATRLAITGTGWQPWTYEQYIEGRNVAKLLETDGSKTLARYAMHQVVETLAGYNSDSLSRQQISGQELTVLPHGIDLQPANMVIADRGGIYLVDIFPPKEVDEQGNPTTYNTKLDNVSPHAIKVACATREGTLLRFLRKTQGLWTSGEFIEEIDEMLATSELPANEAAFIIADMDAGYRLLDAAYSPRAD